MPKEKTKRAKSHENKIINLTTGEVIEDVVTAKENIKQLREVKKNENDVLNANIKAIEKEFGLDGNKIVKDSQTDYFYKVKKSKENNHNILALSHSGRELLFLLMLHMDYMDNVVTIDRKYPSNEELLKLFGMSKVTFQKALRELNESNIVCLVHKGKYRKIILNPYYIEDTMTNKSTWDNFNARTYK